MRNRILGLGSLAVMVGALSIPAIAADIEVAVFGDNTIDGFLDMAAGTNATLVTNADLEGAGFLDSFDVFFYTRDTGTFGETLTAGAATNVADFVGSDGNVVLLNGDFADDVDDANTTIDTLAEQLIFNAVEFAAISGHGYVGEFTGAVAALTTNLNGFAALDLISGSAGALGAGSGGSGGDMDTTAAGTGHLLLNSITLPTNPTDVENGSAITGVDSGIVRAAWVTAPSSPAVIASGIVPEPGTAAALALALAGFGFASGRNKRNV